MEKVIDKNKVIGKINGVNGQIVNVVCSGEYRPKLRELLTSLDDPNIKLEVHSYKSENDMYCLLLSPRDEVYRNIDIVTTGKQITIPGNIMHGF